MDVDRNMFIMFALSKNLYTAEEMRGRSPIVNIMAEEDSQQLFRFDSTVFDY
jgi:hypothetical protein